MSIPPPPPPPPVYRNKPLPPLPGEKPLPLTPGSQVGIPDDLIHFYGQNPVQKEPGKPPEVPIPKKEKETDEQYLARIKGTPELLSKVKTVIDQAPFSEKIRLLAMRRAQAVTGDQRAYAGVAGPNNLTALIGKVQIKGDWFTETLIDQMVADPKRRDRKAMPKYAEKIERDKIKKASTLEEAINNNLITDWEAYRLRLVIAKKRGLISKRYVDDLLTTDDFAKKQSEFLAEGFNYDTPGGGSVFWSGVDPNKLAQHVRNWNAQHGSTMFGQLEVSTDARFMNNAFKCNKAAQYVDGTLRTETNTGGYRGYWDNASKSLAGGVTGHVTSVQLFGVRKDSVFELTELPTILKGMDTQLSKGEKPSVTDISIVVLDPIGPVGSETKCRIFTNRNILHVPIYQTRMGEDGLQRNTFARCKGECTLVGYLSSKMTQRVRTYLYSRSMLASNAANTIQNDWSNEIRY
jgi:hypothetical protein